MAVRPLFIPQFNSKLFDEVNIEFKWIAGQAVSQKQKCIISLHNQAAMINIKPLLEISSKSLQPEGIILSAFILKLKLSPESESPVESVYQGSKVFEGGGPYKDIINKPPRDARKDERLFNSGRLIGFSFNNETWGLDTDSAFYDFLYLNALQHNKSLSSYLFSYKGFTDIEFNPERQISCQARTAAIFVSLSKMGLLNNAIKTKNNFLSVRKGNLKTKQLELFGGK